MKKYSLFSYLTGLLAIFLFLSACDKFEEDTSPLLTSRLVLKNDVYATTMNQAIQLQVLANDSLSGNTAVQFGSPMHGTLKETGTPGSAFYQPDLNFTGRDSIHYTVCIGSNCIGADVLITVQPDSVTNPCTVVIVRDTISVYANQPSLINILQNDVACNFTPVILQQPASGVASINSSRLLVYSPDPNFTGKDSVTYRLGNKTGKVEIRVKAVTPTCTLSANPDMVNLTHNQPVDSIAINVAANDIWCPNAPTLSIHLVSQSSYGSVQVIGSGTNSRIVYLTNTSLRNVTDNFQYRICQGANCSTSTVTVNIQ